MSDKAFRSSFQELLALATVIRLNVNTLPHKPRLSPELVSQDAQGRLTNATRSPSVEYM